MKILFISGHGAGDVGATGNGYKEADLTRELVNMLASKMKQYASVDVYDQSRNAFYDCQSGKFNIGAYDYVFEVHFNAFNISAYGTECFVVPEEKGITVEQEVMKRMGKWFKLRDNDNIFDGVKRTRFLVINTVKQRGMSGALLETCFIDNPNDMSIYQANKDKIASDIVEGIAVGFNLVNNNNKPSTPVTPVYPSKKPVDVIAKEVISGIWGNGADRKKKLEAAGYNYNEVQMMVDSILLGNSKPSTPSKKPIDTVAREVINGLWGNGSDRKSKLEAAGYNYSEVQDRVNSMLGTTVPNKKTNEVIANEVIKGLWGNGADRKRKLEAAGYNYNAVQSIVNRLLG